MEIHDPESIDLLRPGREPIPEKVEIVKESHPSMPANRPTDARIVGTAWIGESEGRAIGTGIGHKSRNEMVRRSATGYGPSTGANPVPRPGSPSTRTARATLT